MRRNAFLFTTFVFWAASLDSAEDWPEWRGRGRTGVWNETGILATFPAVGLKVNRRTPIHNGYSGPAVAAGRVFVTDFAQPQGYRGLERVLCLDELKGKTLWARKWEADYIGLMETYATGPRATPTVDQDRVYLLGSKGKLLCLGVKTSSIWWKKDYQKDYLTEVPVWGMTAAPLIEGDRLIGLVGDNPAIKWWLLTNAPARKPGGHCRRTLNRDTVRCLHSARAGADRSSSGTRRPCSVASRGRASEDLHEKPSLPLLGY